MTTAVSVLEPLTIIKAQRYAQVHGCPRCQSTIFIEQCYHEAETIHQFRCVACGWRDDVRHINDLVTREVERQEKRAATQESDPWMGKEV